MHLFICATTLQLALALRIAQEEHLHKKYDLLFLGNPKISRKQIFLNNHQESACKVVYFHQGKELKKRSAFYLAKIAKKLKNQLPSSHYQRVYISNTYNKFYGFLLSEITFTELCTFDDGVDNINPESMFYTQRNDPFLKRWVQKLQEGSIGSLIL